VLLERAFSSVLKRHLNILLETIFHRLEKVYPYYSQELSSPSMSPQLNRYVISLFGILQVILRGPEFDPDSKERRVTLSNGTVIDELFFMRTIRFAQLPDEVCGQWLDDPQSALEDSVNGLAVRTAVLSCAAEVPFSPDGSDNSILEYPLQKSGFGISIQSSESSAFKICSNT
jgi:hypothetical protein